MKPALLIFCLLFSSYTVFSHPAKEDFDYSIVFGGCFDKDIVSLKINNTSIFDRYRVDNKSTEKKGNLSLTQTNKNISLFYNGQQKIRNKIKFTYYLNIDLIINNKIKRFKIDLRRGKVILFEFCSPETTEQIAKKVTVEQYQEEVIFM